MGSNETSDYGIKTTEVKLYYEWIWLNVIKSQFSKVSSNVLKKFYRNFTVYMGDSKLGILTDPYDSIFELRKKL